MDVYVEAKELFMAGVDCQQNHRFEDAENFYRKALELVPDRVSVMNNLAAVLLQRRQYDEAKSLCDKVLSLTAADADAILNLGNCHLALKSPAEALKAFDNVLAINPGWAEAHVGRSAALIGLCRVEESLASSEQALALDADCAEAFNNRGNALHRLGRNLEALASYDRAVAVKCDFAEAFYNRANTLRDLRRSDDALKSVDVALRLSTNYVEALNCRAVVLRDLKRNDEAFACVERALAIDPDYVEALHNNGNWLMMSERYEEAAENFERLLHTDSEWEYAIGQLVYCRAHMCDWRDSTPKVAELAARVRAGKRAVTPFPMLAISDSAPDQLRCARIWVADQHPPSLNPLSRGERYRHDRIRIAYMSAEFREHATSYLIAELFDLHDKTRFETHAISIGADDRSPMRTRLERAFDHFLDVRDKSDSEVASLLRALEIDILVDLNGYFGPARTGIFAERPAPIQINYLGFPGTLGADYYDYIIADRCVIPEDQRQHYAEHVVYLPDTYQVNDSTRRISPDIPTREEAGLPLSAFVFCCFNNNHKITAEVFAVWMRLLKRVDNSVLWLLQGNPVVVENLRREAEAQGVAANRLVFASRVELADHLARHRLADLFLDTLPHNAHTTASDALWSGLPVLTCLGTTFAGRVAASLLHAVGLPELVTHNWQDYEVLALRLAGDDGLLGEIKAKLAVNRTTHPLFDTKRFRRHIEAAYTTMWERYQRGEPPTAFAVPVAG